MLRFESAESLAEETSKAKDCMLPSNARNRTADVCRAQREADCQKKDLTINVMSLYFISVESIIYVCCVAEAVYNDSEVSKEEPTCERLLDS